jgi:hypothetical protein
MTKPTPNIIASVVVKLNWGLGGGVREGGRLLVSIGVDQVRFK